MKKTRKTKTKSKNLPQENHRETLNELLKAQYAISQHLFEAHFESYENPMALLRDALNILEKDYSEFMASVVKGAK